jgi:hypothetical protein
LCVRKIHQGALLFRGTSCIGSGSPVSRKAVFSAASQEDSPHRWGNCDIANNKAMAFKNPAMTGCGQYCTREPRTSYLPHQPGRRPG